MSEQKDMDPDVDMDGISLFNNPNGMINHAILKKVPAQLIITNSQENDESIKGTLFGKPFSSLQEAYAVNESILLDEDALGSCLEIINASTDFRLHPDALHKLGSLSQAVLDKFDIFTKIVYHDNEIEDCWIYLSTILESNKITCVAGIKMYILFFWLRRRYPLLLENIRDKMPNFSKLILSKGDERGNVDQIGYDDFLHLCRGLKDSRCGEINMIDDSAQKEIVFSPVEEQSTSEIEESEFKRLFVANFDRALSYYNLDVGYQLNANYHSNNIDPLYTYSYTKLALSIDNLPYNNGYRAMDFSNLTSLYLLLDRNFKSFNAQTIFGHVATAPKLGKLFMKIILFEDHPVTKTYNMLNDYILKGSKSVEMLSIVGCANYLKMGFNKELSAAFPNVRILCLRHMKKYHENGLNNQVKDVNLINNPDYFKDFTKLEVLFCECLKDNRINLPENVKIMSVYNCCDCSSEIKFDVKSNCCNYQVEGFPYTVKYIRYEEKAVNSNIYLKSNLDWNLYTETKKLLTIF
uniref:BTB domain-containing protein n=1 Tax=Rhabditophanes sp. KR3021 TaxID=114890 RepID=A0AC35TJ31_9BILA